MAETNPNINRNRNFVKDSLNLVIDSETRGILASCQSSTAANRLLMVYPNLTISKVATQVYMLANKYSKFDFNDENTIYSQSDLLTGDLKEIADHLKTEDLKNLRKSLQLKMQYMNLLEAVCMNETGPVHEFIGMPWLMPYLIDQINQCDPSKKSYATSFKEMALYNEIPVETYYQEIKMKVDCIGIMMLKNYSIWMKYSELLARCDSTHRSVKNVVNLAREELMVNSWV